jgi:opacity protein-like surface antigen
VGGILATWIPPAKAKEVFRFELEGYWFQVNDLNIEDSFLSLANFGARVGVIDGFELDGAGPRLLFAAAIPGTSGQVEASYRRLSTSDFFVSTETYFGANYDHRGNVRLRLHDFDLRWSQPLVQDQAWKLRGSIGYRYLRAKQDRTESSFLADCCDIPNPFATEQATVSGHGIQAGWELDVAFGSRWHLESIGGWALLRGQQRGQIVVDSESIAGPQRNVLSLDQDSKALDAWELSARLRTELTRGWSAFLGYRFDRWASFESFGASADLSFDGTTAGVGYRFSR